MNAAAALDQRAPICGARTFLPAQLIPAAMALETSPRGAMQSDVQQHLRCTLQAHQAGAHYGLVLDLDGVATGTVWALWEDGLQPGALLVLPDCPGAGDEACSEFASHPGNHSHQLRDQWHDMTSALNQPR